MKVENIAIDKIIPYQFNNKIHGDHQVNMIANSIKEFGFVQPLVIDKDNLLVIGHGRLLAAKKLGLKEVPTVRVDKLNDKQIKKLRILDNKLNESERDTENLNLELDDLGDLNIGDMEIEIEDLFPKPTDKNSDFKNEEIEPDDLGDFEHKCPACGFEFNSSDEK